MDAKPGLPPPVANQRPRISRLPHARKPTRVSGEAGRYQIVQISQASRAYPCWRTAKHPNPHKPQLRADQTEKRGIDRSRQQRHERRRRERSQHTVNPRPPDPHRITPRVPILQRPLRSVLTTSIFHPQSRQRQAISSSQPEGESTGSNRTADLRSRGSERHKLARWAHRRSDPDGRRNGTHTRSRCSKNALDLSPVTESNRRPSPYHGDALPTELTGPVFSCRVCSLAGAA